MSKNWLFISCTNIAALALTGAALGGGFAACPNPAHDCASTGTPGCSDADCCNAVCAFDSFCCVTAWDAICVSEALSTCSIVVCNECCPADLNFDGVVDSADLGLLLSCWGPIVLDACACADFDDSGTVDSADLGSLLVAWGDCPSANECACAAANHDCCTQGDPGCTDQKCCEAVCAVDSFCCVTAWDAICIGEAQSICGLECPGNPACNGASHDCCTTGAPGCTDVDCCNAVCLVDSFCCAVAWDGLCVGEAVSICGLDCASCPPSDHDCYTTGGPGCSDVECCEAVCTVDLFCCQVAWDGICVTEAFSICGTPKCPFECPAGSQAEPELCGQDTDGGCNVPIIGDSNCCVANGGLGCDDPDCSAAVCAVDSFCCQVAWDGICAAEALSICPDVCQLGQPGFAPILCGVPVCGTAWADGNFRDTDWYEIELLTPPGTSVTFSITTTLPMVIGIVDTNGNPDCAFATALNPFAVAGFCGEASFETCVPPGAYWFFAAPNSFNGFPCGTANDYSILLECNGECTPPSCGNAGHDCLTSGGPFCDDVSCCEQICVVNLFCCDVAWDAGCVAQANLACYGNCPAADHDCYTTGGIGCSDEDCCIAVCTIDLFCCQVAWDGICVNEAFSLCGVPKCPYECVGTPEGEPCGSDTNGGCNSPGQDLFGSLSCGETICADAWADGGTRDTDWFALTPTVSGAGIITVTSQLPMVFGLVNSTDCATASSINPFGVTGYCGTASVEVCFEAGVEVWVFGGPNGFAGFPCGSGANFYTISVECTDAECPSTCCFANGGLGCDDATCQDAVCAVDSFCCQVAWDGICAGEAASLCPDLCG